MSEQVRVVFERAALEERLARLHTLRTEIDTRISETEFWLEKWDQVAAAAQPSASEEDEDGSRALPA